MLVDREKGELGFKVAYWGIPGSGKATNLFHLQKQLQPDIEIRIAERETDGTFPDRVLWLDSLLLPPSVVVRGYRIRFHAFAAPGQATRAAIDQVLKAPDAVVLVIDPREDRRGVVADNLELLDELLAEAGSWLDALPHVVQYNKDDLRVTPIEKLRDRFNRHGAPDVRASATRGTGVVETFELAAKLVLAELMKSAS